MCDTREGNWRLVTRGHVWRALGEGAFFNGPVFTPRKRRGEVRKVTFHVILRFAAAQGGERERGPGGLPAVLPRAAVRERPGRAQGGRQPHRLARRNHR